jgi:membrane fusion protein (multidrug efflux system)
MPHLGQRLLIAAALAGLAAGCVDRSHASGPPPPEEPAARVETIRVDEGPVPVSVTLTGTLLANRSSLVAADGAGKVQATFVERGAEVTAGAPLARLDTRGASYSRAEALAQGAAARVQSERARRDCERADQLLAADVVTVAEHERMTAECQTSAAQVRAAAARESMAGKSLADATIRAPFAGVVDERLVSIGEHVRAGQAVATVIEIDPLRLELSVPESAVAQVGEGQTVEFEVAAFPGRTFRGTVRYLSGGVRRQSRDLVAEAVVPNPDRRLRPGMFAVARVRVGERRLPVIPASALRGEGTEARVYAVREGKLEERLVHAGRRDGEKVAVHAGLRAGEIIVVTLAPELRDGTRVE